MAARQAIKYVNNSVDVPPWVFVLKDTPCVISGKFNPVKTIPPLGESLSIIFKPILYKIIGKNHWLWVHTGRKKDLVN